MATRQADKYVRLFPSPSTADDRAMTGTKSSCCCCCYAGQKQPVGATSTTAAALLKGVPKWLSFMAFETVVYKRRGWWRTESSSAQRPCHHTERYIILIGRYTSTGCVTMFKWNASITELIDLGRFHDDASMQCSTAGLKTSVLIKRGSISLYLGGGSILPNL